MDLSLLGMLCSVRGGGSGGITDLKFPVVNELPSNPEVGKPYIYSDERHGDVIALYAYDFWQFIPMYHMTTKHMFLASELMAYSLEDGAEGCVALVDRVMDIEGKSFSKAIRISGMKVDDAKNYVVMTLNVGNSNYALMYLEKFSEQQDKLILEVNGVSVDVAINNLSSPSDIATSGYTAAQTIKLSSGTNVIRVGINKDNSVSKGDDSIYVYGISLVADTAEIVQTESK